MKPLNLTFLSTTKHKTIICIDDKNSFGDTDSIHLLELCFDFHSCYYLQCVSTGCTSAGTSRRLVLCISVKEEKVPLRNCGDTFPGDTKDCEATLIKCPPGSSSGHNPHGHSRSHSSSTMTSFTAAPTTTVSVSSPAPPPKSKITPKPSQTQTTTTSSPLTKWDYSEWEPCTVSCGEGTQTRRPVCVGGSDNSSCLAHQKPDIEKRVCSRPCSIFKWRTGEWTSCSASCGKGIQTRVVDCLDWTDSLVSNNFCEASQKPKDVKRCAVAACPFVWQTTPWSDCSKSCGPAFETRRVTCHRINEYGWVYPKPVRRRKNKLKIGHHSRWSHYCNETSRPITRQDCNLGACGGRGVWQPEAWQPVGIEHLVSSSGHHYVMSILRYE